MSATTPIGGNWKEMFQAVQDDDIELVKYHLETGVDPFFQHSEYLTNPFFEAIRLGNVRIFQLLLSYDKRNYCTTMTESLTECCPLEVAMEYGRHEICDLLLELLDESQTVLKTVLVTGGNRGIGREIARDLLVKGHDVIITCRASSDGEVAVQFLREETSNSKIRCLVGDLSTVESTRVLAKIILEKLPKLDVLVHNAGIWPTTRKMNADGLEMAFMVNYLAPYMLSHDLLPLLKRSTSTSRIVLVNAGLYAKGNATVEETPYGKDFHAIKTYASTKQCNVFFLLHFAKKLQEQEEGTDGTPKKDVVTINAVHPGVIRTSLGEQDGGWMVWFLRHFIKRFWRNPSAGALAPSWLATSIEVEGKSGLFFNEFKVMDYPESVLDPEMQEKWAAWTKNFLSEH